MPVEEMSAPPLHRKLRKVSPKAEVLIVGVPPQAASFLSAAPGDLLSFSPGTDENGNPRIILAKVGESWPKEAE